MPKLLLIAAALVACAAVPSSAAAIGPGGTLTVNKNIAKAGTVTDGTWELDCGPACVSDSAFYADDCEEGVCIPQEVVVSAIPEPGWQLTGWTNCLEENPEAGTCWVSMASSRTITAHFADVGDPTATITAPGNNTTVRGTIGLAADAADNDSVKQVRWLIGNTVLATDNTAPYTGSFNTALMSDGAKTISAQAVDASDRTSTLSSRTITIDNTAPGLGITGGPAAGALVGVSRDVGFQFSTTGASTVECRMESTSWIPCDTSGSHTLIGVADGPHTFFVRASDTAGNAAETTRSFTMDATAPAAQITGATVEDGGVAGGEELTFAFQVTDEPSGVQMSGQCALDDAAFAPCEQTTWHTVTGASEGQHTFRVRGVDAAGNVSAQATREFTVDLSGPQAQITGGTANGAKVGAAGAVAYQFAVTDAKSGVAAVQCALDGGAFTACDSVTAHALSGVGHGAHTFKVRGVDAVGNTGPAATRSFEVDAVAPNTTIDTASTGASSAFTFSSTEPGSTFSCRLYAEGATPPAFGACAGASGSHSTTGLAAGTYVFEVVATDAAGNTDGTPAGKTFTVVPPETGGEDPPPTGGGEDPPPTGGGGKVEDPKVVETGTGTTKNDGTTTTTVTTTVTTTTTPVAEKVDADMTWEFNRLGKRTRANKLVVTGIPQGATVTVTCKGKGCPFARKAFAFKKATLKLAGALRKKRVSAGGVIEVRVTKPGAVGKVFTFKMRPKALPAYRGFCLPDGAPKPVAC